MIYILEAFVFINILISLYICEMHSAFVLYSSVHLFELSWLVCLLALLMLRECMCHGLATQLISSLPVGVRLPSALMALILIFSCLFFLHTSRLLLYVCGECLCCSISVRGVFSPFSSSLNTIQRQTWLLTVAESRIPFIPSQCEDLMHFL